MGVSGCGKSTVGELLGEKIGAQFLDGDSLHPASNIEKMSAGIPLDDADREPWLREVGRRFASTGNSSLIIACSALKLKYRELIREHAPDTLFVHLHGSAQLLAARMADRPGHFMPTGLLESQLKTLEPLLPHEAGTVLNISVSPEQLADQATAWLHSSETV